MNKDTKSSGFVQEATTLASAAIPLLQLFFLKLPETFTQIFKANEYFLGISIVTLVVSYSLIIAYRSKPWFQLTVPFQRSAVREYDEYVAKINDLTDAVKEAKAEYNRQDEAKFSKQLRTLKAVKPPRYINPQNIISICTTIILLSSTLFIAIGQSYEPEYLWRMLQSISYILLVAFTALALSVYYRSSNEDRVRSHEQTVKTSKAIDMAIKSNCFGDIPQVKFISTYDDLQLPNNSHYLVEYGSKRYEITTDYKATKLVSVYELESPA
jgi:hypothetical protein